MKTRTTSRSSRRVAVQRAAATIVALTLLAGVGACDHQAAEPPTATHNAKQGSTASSDHAPVALTREQLERRTVERRAIEAVIWAMPAVNYGLMYEASGL